MLSERRSSEQLSSEQQGTQVTAQDLIQQRVYARNIKFTSRHRASAHISGAQQSRFRGRGVDFLESRAYQAGDDIRTMDWRVTARTGRPHSKIYQEERERPIFVIIDCNPSMFFATRVAFKAVIAARLAALIGWAAMQNGDRVGAFIYGPAGHRDCAPKGGRSGVMQLIRLLVNWVDNKHHQQGTSDLNTALLSLRRVVRPGSLLFIISKIFMLNLLN